MVVQNTPNLFHFNIYFYQRKHHFIIFIYFISRRKVHIIRNLNTRPINLYLTLRFEGATLKNWYNLRLKCPTDKFILTLRFEGVTLKDWYNLRLKYPTDKFILTLRFEGVTLKDWYNLRLECPTDKLILSSRYFQIALPVGQPTYSVNPIYLPEIKNRRIA